MFYLPKPLSVHERRKRKKKKHFIIKRWQDKQEDVEQNFAKKHQKTKFISQVKSGKQHSGRKLDT